jgi:hypothetical protein
MESRNVVVCDNGTGVSPPLPDPHHLRFLPRLDPPPVLTLGHARVSRVPPPTQSAAASATDSEEPVREWTAGGWIRLDGGWEPWMTRSETRLFAGASVAAVW